MKKYYGLTIGPIYDTISQVRRTRSIWAASYLFSWIMKEILFDISKREDIKIVLPYFDQNAKSANGAGLYGDRAYFLSEENGKEILEECISTVLDKLLKGIGGTKDFLENYFNFNIETYEYNEKLPLDEINKALDHAELFKIMPQGIDSNHVVEYLSQLNKNSLLHEEAFEKSNKRTFLSISEIATTSLARLNTEKYNKIVLDDLKAAKQDKKTPFNEDFEFIEAAKRQFKDGFKAHHKYFGVLYADGDNIGTLLGQCQTNEELQIFSKALLEFGLRADKTISEYGGKGIYLGGEDILAFVPVACIDGVGQNQSVLELVYKLDLDFEATVQKFATEKNVEPSPTLSYGLMIAYHKYPLKEALSTAHELLEYVKNNIENKNAINILFQKHSGQKNGCVILKKETQVYEKIRELVNYQADKEEFLSGFMHRLNEDYIYELFSKSLESNYSTDAFIKNFMDIPTLAVGSFEEKLIELARLIHDQYDGSDKEKLTGAKQVLFTILRLNQFLNAKNDE